jgi:hypothetical protein
MSAAQCRWKNAPVVMRKKVRTQAAASHGRRPAWTDENRANIPDKAKIVRRILEAAKPKDGNPFTAKGDLAIANTLEAEGYCTFRGAKCWSPATTNSIIHNPALRGYRVLGKWDENGKHQVLEIVPGYYEPFLNDDEYAEIINARMARSKGGGSGKNGKFLNLLKGATLVRLWWSGCLSWSGPHNSDPPPLSGQHAQRPIPQFVRGCRRVL